MPSSDLLYRLQGLSREQLENLVAQATPGVLAGLHDELRDACTRDGLYFLKFVRTRDEADPDTPVKPFPLHLPYVSEFWRVLEREQRVVCAKSRQMLVSWILCAFCCWWARSHANQAVYWQTQKAEDAYEKVALPVTGGVGYLGRCQFIEANLPPWLQVLDLRKSTSEGRIVYPNGSLIQALPGGADQIRGKVASLVIQDEFAFQEEARGVYAAVAPLIQKGMKFFCVSTPNGAENTFAKLYHGTL